MLPHLSQRDRRTILVGLTAVIAILVFGRVLPAVKRWEAGRLAEALEARGELIEAERSAGSIAMIRDSARVRSLRLEATRSRLIRATTAAAAAAVLGGLIESLAKNEGVDVQTMTLRPDTTTRNGLARVAVRFGAEGDVEGLTGLLLALEGHEKLFAVRDLSVSQAEPVAAATHVEALRFDLTVETLARVGGSPTKAAARGTR
jgi:hypothetical protein